jgi:hypothetical protein
VLLTTEANGKNLFFFKFTLRCKQSYIVPAICRSDIATLVAKNLPPVLLILVANFKFATTPAENLPLEKEGIQYITDSLIPPHDPC